MPGHVKLGKAGEPDPDPCPYLVVTLEMKREFALKVYDPKKSYWCPDGKGGYMEGILEDDDGTKAVMLCGHEVRFLIFFSPFDTFVYNVGYEIELETFRGRIKIIFILSFF